MIKQSLKKLLLTMLKDEYPQIKDVVVNSSNLMGGLGTSYNVGVGINYGDLMKMSDEDEKLLKSKIRNLSKYVLGKNESLESSFFYDPN